MDGAIDSLISTSLSKIASVPLGMYMMCNIFVLILLKVIVQFIFNVEGFLLRKLMTDKNLEN